MRALEWLRVSGKHPLKPTYAVFGDDLYLRREATNAVFRAALRGQIDEMAVSRFEGKSASLADVLDELRMLPFFTSRRIVVIDEADPFVTKYRREIEAHVEAPKGDGILVLMLKSLPSNTRLSRLIDESGLALDCNSPPEKDLAAWLMEFAAKFQTHLDPDAAGLLLELVGADVGILAAEVEKLAVYVGASGRVRRADVSKVVEAGRIETVWHILDAATTGQAAAAIKHLDDLLASGEHPIRVLAGFTSSLLKIHHAGQLRVARATLQDACRIAGVFSVEKTRREHAHLGPSRVDQIPALLLKADLDLKGGSMLDPRAVLEDFLVKLAIPRID
jgi:DNA polymerase-3 subunit delta